MDLKELVKTKKILFVTTKNIDYIRNTQEIRLLEENAASLDLIYSNRKNYLSRILSVWKQISRNTVHDKDIIFIGFAPQLIVPFVGKRLKGKMVVIDFFISVYDTVICDRKKFREGGLVSKLCHKLDEYTLKRADYVITDTKAHADFFVTEFGGDKERVETIYLEANSKIYYPRPQNKPEKLKDKFVVLYFGSILPVQGVDIVLGAIKELRNKEDIYFDIIGPIPSKYNKPIQDNVLYTDWLTQEELAERIANADLCLAGHFSGSIDKAKRTIPGKAYIYEMMRKTMILGDSIANHELYKEDDRHKFIPMGSVRNLVEKIMEVCSSESSIYIDRRC